MTLEIALKPRAPTVVSTAGFIRTRLRLTKGDFCYHVWKEFSSYLVEQVSEKPPKFTSFARYWWILKELGLIESFGKPKPSKRGRPAVFYRVVAGMEGSPKWKNPQAEFDIIKDRLFLDPSTKEKVPKSRLGARRYRRRVLGLPPRKPGRPRKIVPPPGLIPPTPTPHLTTQDLNKIWLVTESFLRENGYSITREELEEIIPDWPSYLEDTDPATGELIYKTFKQKVGFVIHETVEIEVVSLRKGELYDPRKAPEVIRDVAHRKAVDMEKKWLRKK